LRKIARDDDDPPVDGALLEVLAVDCCGEWTSIMVEMVMIVITIVVIGVIVAVWSTSSSSLSEVSLSWKGLEIFCLRKIARDNDDPPLDGGTIVEVVADDCCGEWASIMVEMIIIDRRRHQCCHSSIDRLSS
jgi:hypothetical protein